MPPRSVIATIPTRPTSWASRVMPFRSAVKTGMITASLMTSQVSMTPAKSPTSRAMRASRSSRISPVGSSVSQGGVTVCQHSG